MKHIIFALLIAMPIWAIGQARTAKITFQKIEHDFGTIKEADGKVSYEFTFTNTGTIPLIITNVDASCGCTTPTWTKTPVLPGKTGSIIAEFNPENTRIFSKTIAVTTNGDPNKVVLTIKGEVVPKDKSVAELYPQQFGELRTKSKNIPFANLNASEIKTERFEIFNDSKKTVNISFKNLPQHISVKATSSLGPAQSGIVEITYNAAKNTQKGYLKDLLTLVVNGVAYENALKVSATLQ